MSEWIERIATAINDARAEGEIAQAIAAIAAMRAMIDAALEEAKAASNEVRTK